MMKTTLAGLLLCCLAHAVVSQNELMPAISKEDTSTVPCAGDELCGELQRSKRCGWGGCLKRSARQDDLGPFWANRGKKDPKYYPNKLFAEEPHWVLIRDENSAMNYLDPFFITRGKKESDISDRSNYLSRLEMRDRRDRLRLFADVAPFQAARGKRQDED